MGKLRDKMATDLRLKGFRPNTQEAYLRSVRRFASHFRRSPDLLGKAEVRSFLDHLVCDRKVSPSTARSTTFALGRPAQLPHRYRARPRGSCLSRLSPSTVCASARAASSCLPPAAQCDARLTHTNFCFARSINHGGGYSA
jgi:hypothetical protein